MGAGAPSPPSAPLRKGWDGLLDDHGRKAFSSLSPMADLSGKTMGWEVGGMGS